MTERSQMEINGTRYTRLADVPAEYRALLLDLTPGGQAEPPAVPLREIVRKARAQPDRGRQQQVVIEELRKIDPERAQRLQNTLSGRRQRPAAGTLEIGATPTARPREGARTTAGGTTVAPGDRPGLGLWLLLAAVVVVTVIAWATR